MSAAILYFWLIVLLDIVMLAVIGLQRIWRQRVVQLVIVAVCAVCFAVMFVGATHDVLFGYVPGTFVLLSISLFLTTAGSVATLVYLIIAMKRGDQRLAPAAAYAVSTHVGPPPPLPPTTEWAAAHSAQSHLGPPPVPPARMGTSANMPLAVAILIISVFAVSLLFRLYGLATVPRLLQSPVMLLSIVVDLVMIAFGIWYARWPYRKVAFSVVLVATLVLIYFFLTYNYSIYIRYDRIFRYGHGSLMTLYVYELLAVLRIAAAGTALAYSIGPAFGKPYPSIPVAPPPPLPNAR